MSDSNGSNKNKSHGPADLLNLGGSNHAAEEHGEGNWLVSYADMMTLLVGFFVILLSFAVVDAEKFDEARKAITQQFGGTYQVPYSELADRIKEAIKKLGVGDQLLLKSADSGLEISFKGTVFFDTGSADLKDAAIPVLDSLIKAVKEDADPLDITVEGHTDDVPIVHGKLYRNNWELSSVRACRVLETFIQAGLPKERLTAVGYGEARPLVPNEDSSGTQIPENQAQNRRVIIRIVRHSQPALTREIRDSNAAPPVQDESPVQPGEGSSDVNKSGGAESSQVEPKSSSVDSMAKASGNEPTPVVSPAPTPNAPVTTPAPESH